MLYRLSKRMRKALSLSVTLAECWLSLSLSSYGLLMCFALLKSLGAREQNVSVFLQGTKASS